MHVPFRWVVAGCLLTACNAGPNAKQTSKDTAGTSPVMQEMHGGDLYFETHLPAASSPGRVIGLTLRGTGDAELVTDYQNYQPESIAAGPWQENGNIIRMVLTNVHGHSTAKDTLTFLQQQHKLIYQGKDFGTKGLILTEKPKPKPQPRIIIMWVGPEKVQCVATNGDTRECLQIAFGKFPPEKASDWEAFDEDIKGFSFRKGKTQQVKVLRTPRRGQLQSESQYSYQMQQVMKEQ